MYMYTHQGNSYYAVRPMNQMSFIRILHASPDAPAVDVYANGNIIAEGLTYKQLTNYLPIIPGNYQIQVYPTGTNTDPVIDTTVMIPQNSAFTIAAVGRLSDISLLPIPEAYMPHMLIGMSDNSYVRFVHLSPNAPAVDITLPNGTKLFENVSYQQFSDYIAVNSGNYTLQVRPTGSDQVVLTIPNVNLMPGVIYSIYAVGLVGDQPPLEAIIAVDGEYQ
ncbi:DUF4397 domain-containing protein [Lacrimispora algidixylanolytica]|uniref:DUF4397 domain-containing protein n=1 Tax=Lacrimispora algidixylanolytica TaxID=94868 RepID=A0A419TCQ6_9FIRM|nr:DUF4397 domain-containing protein [Lacrimispora algidixylanolytica]RKD35248.1 hypothetical protein BET01_02585 [Lacrimispora algidixylanolytica]